VALSVEPHDSVIVVMRQEGATTDGLLAEQHSVVTCPRLAVGVLNGNGPRRRASIKLYNCW